MESRATSLSQLRAALAPYLTSCTGEGEPHFTGVQSDSRLIVPGDLFVARGDGRRHGIEFLAQAQALGAVAVLTDGAAVVPEGPVTLRSDRLREAVAAAAHLVAGEPSKSLRVFGVTGTNGKTTIVTVLQQALELAGRKVASLGTLGYSCGGVTEDTGFTTPEADEVARRMARALREGARHFCMEVSSHALDQHRVGAVHFAVTAFTNLTQDHLDYHGTLEAYGEAKARLFRAWDYERAIVHVGDAFGRKLAAEIGERAWGVSVEDGGALVLREAEVTARGTAGWVHFEGERVRLESPLVGAHNGENLLVVLGALLAEGFSLPEACELLGRVAAAPGRLEPCHGEGDDCAVLVDYAHTPDALEKALRACRAVTTGRLICVFGCGGDRDRTKRPLMGAIAGRLADAVYVTSDNPRTEEPEAILRDIDPGLLGSAVPVARMPDRAEAIASAVAEAKPGDLVLIAGKGHEDYQIIGREKRHFDDREHARHALARRRGEG